MDDYSQLLQYMKNHYESINGYDFYSAIFPDIENQGDQYYDYSHPNPIYIYWDETKNKKKRRIMLKDTWAKDYNTYIKDNSFTLCSGLTFRGRANRSENAQNMNALIFDLDGVGLDEFHVIEQRWKMLPEQMRAFPRPTYTVLSGSGLHLYYVFEEPIPLFPFTIKQLQNLKYDITFSIWEYGETSKEKNIQYQSINQSFRMPDSFNCKESTPHRVVAFHTGSVMTIDTLNQYVKNPDNLVDLTKLFEPSSMTREDAKLKYPQWHERFVVPVERRKEIQDELAVLDDIPENNDRINELLEELSLIQKTLRKNKKTKGKWEIDKKVNGNDPYALYHWWIEQLPLVTGGHRYYFFMVLAIYASKCNVPRKQLVDDMDKLFETVAAIPHKNKFTKDDLKSALRAYDKEHFHTSIEAINRWMGFTIQRNKRNGRSTYEHLQAKYWRNEKGRREVNICRQNRELALEDMREAGEIPGRPLGESIQRRTIMEWQELHPNGRKSECHNETGIHYSTINKWWDNELGGIEIKGRPSLAIKVEIWQLEHPTGTKAECQKETGLSRPTINKWWNDSFGNVQVGRPKGSSTKKEQVIAWRQSHPSGTKSECHIATGISKPTINKWWSF